MITLAGTRWSFDRASENLEEFCHLLVSDDTIERVCQEEGERAKDWVQQSSQLVKAFEAAAGQAEFSSDGVQINTVGGWREMRLSVLAKREPTQGCEPSQWDKRVLNEPTTRMAICRIADANHIGADWKRLSDRMNLKDQPAVDVLADAAKWIWDQAGKRLPRHNGKWCVDVYHVSEHLHQCGRELFSESAKARAWADEMLHGVLEHNGPALIARAETQLREEPKSSVNRRPLERLLTFLRPNRDRMWYKDRLAAGLPIGSGLIEGGCKNIIGARLKLNNARWRIRRAERIGMLRCVDASKQWSNFWLPAA